MPKNDYECPDCGAIVKDLWVKKGEAPKCPKCGAAMAWLPAKSAYGFKIK